MTARRPGISTIAVHGPLHRRPDWSPVTPPLIQSSTFTNPVGSDEEIVYSRYGTNPTQLAVARKYALLEGAEDAVFVASGMGATALARQLCSAVEATPCVFEGREIRVTVSIGVAGGSVTSLDRWDTLIAAADRALYEAKNAGRNRVAG